MDASDPTSVAEVAKADGCDAILNAVDPRFVPGVFRGAFEAGAMYVDMAMSLSEPHPERAVRAAGQEARRRPVRRGAAWEERGLLALVGCGVEPGLSDVFARYAADHLFSSIDECGVRDGSNITVAGYDFAPSFSIWTTIEECLNPPVIWEKERGWFTTPPFSEPETFVFPEGIGPIECVNVEHEEVLLIPRWVDCAAGDVQVRPGRRVHRRAEDRSTSSDWTRRRDGPGRRRRGRAPRRRRGGAARSRDPRRPHDGRDVRRHLGDGDRNRRHGPDEVYLFHAVDNEETFGRDGAQAVVWQTAINPVVAFELLASGAWSGAGVLGPEAFDAVPFLDLLKDHGLALGHRGAVVLAGRHPG